VHPSGAPAASLGPLLLPPLLLLEVDEPPELLEPLLELELPASCRPEPEELPPVLPVPLEPLELEGEDDDDDPLPLLEDDEPELEPPPSSELAPDR
jgi:hypothetical protein